jgi:hypothetical protein
MVCLLVVNDYSFLTSGWWGLLKTFLLLHLLVALRILRYIGIPWVDFIFQEIFTWISTRGKSQYWFQTRQNFDRVGKLVRKVFTSSHCYLHWYLLNVESALMARFWRVFTLLFAWWRSNTWVFGPKWWKRAELQKLGLDLILLWSMLVGLLEV